MSDFRARRAKLQATRWQVGGGVEPIAPAVTALFSAGLDIWDAFDIMQRALSVRWLERIKTAMRRPVNCPFEEEGGPTPGVPPCYLSDPDSYEWDGEYPCPDCMLKIAEWQHVRPLLNRARRRLRAALDRRIGRSE